MVEDSKENREKCICSKCPSFPEGCKGETLYCTGKNSKCDIRSRGCICNICPVYFENKLNNIYFCLKERVGESNILMRKKGLKEDPSFYNSVVHIKEMAAKAKSIVTSMGSLKEMPFSFDDLHFIPAQVNKIPLNKEEKINTEVIIGSESKKPLRVSSPILISGMSYGAVSKKVRLIISQAAKALKIGFNSGEGGATKEELDLASDYLIGQYSTGRFGINEESIKSFAAIEIRFGQGAYPGKGSFLPADKVIPDIAKVRGLKKGESANSPAHHSDMTNLEEIRKKVSWLRELTKGIPIGAKIGCGNIEKDVKALVEAGVDFIALDGFGGGTGATDLYVRENVGIPIIAALPRAFKALQNLKAKDKITLIAGGGLRSSADFTKCLALGADAVYIATAALIAINCEQYRICHTGLCPTGITTNNPALVKELDLEEGIRKLSNYILLSTQEIANFSRILGKDDISKIDIDDIISLNENLSAITSIKGLGIK